MTKRILITGATGLIGRQLVKHLSPQYALTLITRDVARAKRLFSELNLNAGNERQTQDQHECITLEELTEIEQFYGVINLAGEPIADKRWSPSQKNRICDSRWHITRSLVEHINSSLSPPAVFISGSAIGFYGRQGDEAITEAHQQYHQEFSREVCQNWEVIALGAQNTRICILRTGIVLAEQGGALAKMLMPFRLGLGGPIGDGKQYMSWIHIDDMVRAIVFLLENEYAPSTGEAASGEENDAATHQQVRLDGPFNLTAPNPNTNGYFSVWLARRLERPCVMRVPAFVMKLMMGESSDLVLYGQKVIPQKLLDAGFTFEHPALKGALADLEL